MSRVFCCCIWIMISVVVPAFAENPDPLISKAEIERLLSYPAERLQVRDLTEAAKQKFPQVLSATEYYSEDDSFASLVIGAAAEKSILTQDSVAAEESILSRELVKGINENLQKVQSQGGIPRFRRIDLGNGIQGFAGLGRIGPGFREYRVSVTVPGRMDVQVKLIVSGHGFTLDPETAYGKLIIEGGERLTNQLIECAKVAVVHATKAAPGKREPESAPVADTPKR